MNLTYSFLNVKATIAGPGGNFNLSTEAAPAEEGLTVEMVDDKNTMTVGAAGNAMHSLHASKAGTVHVRLLKTSPVNHNLAAMYALQEAAPALWGSNVILITDKVTGDVISCRQVAFKKLPAQTFAKDGGMLEWTFDAGQVDMDLAGLLAAAVGA